MGTFIWNEFYKARQIRENNNDFNGVSYFHIDDIIQFLIDSGCKSSASRIRTLNNKEQRVLLSIYEFIDVVGDSRPIEDFDLDVNSIKLFLKEEFPVHYHTKDKEQQLDSEVDKILNALDEKELISIFNHIPGDFGTIIYIVDSDEDPELEIWESIREGVLSANLSDKQREIKKDREAKIHFQNTGFYPEEIGQIQSIIRKEKQLEENIPVRHYFGFSEIKDSRFTGVVFRFEDGNIFPKNPKIGEFMDSEEYKDGESSLN